MAKNKKFLGNAIIICALGVLLIAAANGLDCNGGSASGNYAVYCIGMFITRCGCMINQMAGFMLVANWFIRFCGQAMGIVTVGSPLFSVVGTSVMTNFIKNRLAGDYRPFYAGIAILIIVVVILIALLVKDVPEDAGLYPDGADHPPISEQVEEVKLTLGQILRQKKAWQLIISFGAYQFIIAACMGSMAVYYMSLGGQEVWITATRWLAMGAILGVNISQQTGLSWQFS